MEEKFYVAAFVTWSISLKIPPFQFISTSNVSNLATSPLFRTKILSQSLIVFKRCAIVIIVEDLNSSKQQNSAIKVVTYRKMPVTKMLWNSVIKLNKNIIFTARDEDMMF